MHYLEGDAVDLDGAMHDYGRRLLSAPVDLAFVGIGENGHIAFNDPHVADFNDVQVVKRVALDEACQRQAHAPVGRIVSRRGIGVAAVARLPQNELLHARPKSPRTRGGLRP